MDGDWTESEGGPLILLPASHVATWRGNVVGNEGGASDYERACEIDDLVGVLPLEGAGRALVLGDEPLPTAILDQADPPMLVRWVSAPSAETLLSYAARSVVPSVPDEEVEVRIDEDLVLMDAVLTGDEAKANPLQVLRVIAGRYRVVTKRVEVGNEVEFVVHWLVRQLP